MVAPILVYRKKWLASLACPAYISLRSSRGQLYVNSWPIESFGALLTPLISLLLNGRLTYSHAAFMSD